MSKISHYFDIVVYLVHRTYWNICAHFGRVYGLVLMYHHITDDHVDIMESCQHTPTVFETTLKRLLDEGYEFVTVERMLEIIERKISKRFAVITFDDIRDDVYTNALPILKSMNLPFTLFVAPGLLDTEKFVTTEHLMEMANNPLCTIGAHSLTHCSLRKVTNSKEEMVESKRRLEHILGKEVKYMAYPYGWHCDVSSRNMKEAQEAGYECAFGTIQSPVSQVSAKSRYYLPRVVLKG